MDEVVVDVHLLRRDVVEGDDRVGAAAGALLQLEGLVQGDPSACGKGYVDISSDSYRGSLRRN